MCVCVCLLACVSLQKTDLVDRLSKSTFFTACDFNKLGQPCLSLSRPFLFRKCIGDVVASKGGYGRAQTAVEPSQQTFVVHIPSTPPLAMKDDVCSPRPVTTIDEGRVMLAAGLLCRVLHCRGHVVRVTCPLLLRDDLAHEMLRPFVMTIATTTATTEEGSGGNIGEEVSLASCVRALALGLGDSCCIPPQSESESASAASKCSIHNMSGYWELTCNKRSCREFFFLNYSMHCRWMRLIAFYCVVFMG